MYLEQKEFDKCMEKCEEGIKVGRANYAPYEAVAKAYARMGACMHKQGNLAEAIKYYKTAQVEHRTDVVMRKIRKLEKQLKEQEAKAYLNPEKAAEAKARGNEKFKAGSFPEAIKEYSEAIARDPTNAVYYNNRAAAYTKLADFGRAKEDCEKALELDPSYVKAWARKGSIEFFIKEYHKAIESYKSGLALDPNNQSAYRACRERQQRYRRLVVKQISSAHKGPWKILKSEL